MRARPVANHTRADSTRVSRPHARAMADEMFARVGALRRLLIATLAVTGETLARARRGAQVQTLDAEAGGGAGAGDEDHIDRCLRQGGGHRYGVHAGVVERLAGRVGRPIGNRFRRRRHALRAIALRHIEAVAEDHLRGVQLGTGENAGFNPPGSVSVFLNTQYEVLIAGSPATGTIVYDYIFANGFE
jgi:hypothetical protein